MPFTRMDMYRLTDSFSPAAVRDWTNSRLLKICSFLPWHFVPCLFEEKRGDMVFSFSWFVVPSSSPSDSMYLVSITFPAVLSFFAILFETVQIFLSWSEDVHVIWINFYNFFSVLDLVIFSGSDTVFPQLPLQFYAIYS